MQQFQCSTQDSYELFSWKLCAWLRVNLSRELTRSRRVLVELVRFTNSFLWFNVIHFVLQEACIFFAVAILYFFLVGFGWMLIEGIQLYQRVVSVFRANERMLLKCVLAWGERIILSPANYGTNKIEPFLFVDSFGCPRKNYCWVWAVIASVPEWCSRVSPIPRYCSYK